MNIIDALREPALQLPKYSDETLFTIFLEKSCANFLETIDSIDKGTIAKKIREHRDTLQKFCDGIVQSATTYYHGFPAKAYFEFEQSMKLLEPFLFPEKSGMVTTLEFEPYYRARTGANRQFERKEMFHMPFEKREYVTTQRFSVPGLPCLYLANSVYVCWEELRRPDINKMQVSRFKLENYHIKFLDISMTPSFLSKMLEVTTSSEKSEGSSEPPAMSLNDWDGIVMSFIMKWPLIMSCAIKVKKLDGTFKPEYIFPQFLLQWVTNNKQISGIKYFSVEAHLSSKIDHSQYINYALPIKSFSDTGLCKKLVDSFSLTEPISWEMLTMSNPNVIAKNQQKLENNVQKLGLMNNLTLELIKGKSMLYTDTVFGKIEIEIAEMTFEKIILS